MPPRVASHATASARVAASACASAVNASARVCGACGNVTVATPVSSTTTSQARMRMRTLLLALAIACGPVLAAGDPVTAETKDPVLDNVGAATKRQDWTGAAGILK